MNIATNHSGKILLLGKEDGALAYIKQKNAADPNISFISPAELEKLDPNMDGEFAAIIAVLSELDDDRQACVLGLQRLEPFTSSKLILLHDPRVPSKILTSAFRQATVFMCSLTDTDHLDDIIRKSKIHHQEKTRLLEDKKDMEHTFQLMERGVFKIKTLPQAKSLSILLASLCPSSTELALGLIELMINAIEHGNLEITFEEKGELLASGNWQLEIDRRLQLPKYKEKQVTIEFIQKSKTVEFLITDEGAGFNSGKYLGDKPKTDRKSDLKIFHGRGIKLASQVCFDQLEYLGTGEQVKATIKLE